MAKSLYDSFYLNFTRPLPRSLMEEFAALIAANGTASLVEQVFDQYLDFVVLEPSLFTLSPSPTATKDSDRSTYEQLHDPAAKEDDIDQIVDRIAAGLFSIIATLGQLPIIRCPRGNAAEMVARKLDAKLKEHVASRGGTLFTSDSAAGAFQRPVLIILDRNIDLTPMVSHSWTYQALVNDVLEMKLNRITVQALENGKMIRRSYDLDGKDFFWEANAASPFPQVAEEIDTALTKCAFARWRSTSADAGFRYKSDAAELTKSTGIGDLSDVSQMCVGFKVRFHTERTPQRRGLQRSAPQSRHHCSTRAYSPQADPRRPHEHRFRVIRRHQGPRPRHALPNGGSHSKTDESDHPRSHPRLVQAQRRPNRQAPPPHLLLPLHRRQRPLQLGPRGP
jgi:hypothetical protein